MQYRLCDDTWDCAEKRAISRVVGTNRFTMGEEVERYEKEFAEKFRVRHAVMASSGSAANLLAVAALVYSGRLKSGDEVLVTAVSWSTTYFPLYQMGLKIRFLDIDKETLNIDAGLLEAAVTPATKMVLAVNLLGNPNDFEQITAVCRKKGLLLLEDNCESLGGEYKGKKLGTFGVIGTFSTFYSHHLCTMEGGVAVTDDLELYHCMRVIRAHGWTRDLPADSPLYQKSQDPFYESYHFILPGFNLRPIEIEAAVGREQLKKMDGIIAARRENAAYFKEKMAGLRGMRLQKETGCSSWFGFAVVLENGFCGKRDAVVKRLEKAGVEVRPVVAGNFTKNRAVEFLDYSIFGSLKGADDVHENGFFVGNHGKADRSGIDYLTVCIRKILNEV
ncbi:MAG: DegT/DnrJ/EryC1/StrS family aminotransferase [Eubacterium sp.]|nr:DegT/DnrJ/EryC1/StrS family aminotransferase [Eubacterium sp.]